MESAILIKPTVEQIKKRHAQYWRDMEVFTRMLVDIHNRMPLRGYIKYKDGSFEQLPPPPEWQKLIDQVEKERNDFIKERYPDLLPELTLPNSIEKTLVN